jgi:thiosulfate/3-mercaptopyruvate sulfurtransferase
MRWTTLIDVEELAERLDDCVVVDCRHTLSDPAAGRRGHRDARIPGSRFLHLDEDLAAPVRAGSGRHPLPDPERLRARLAGLGLSDDTQLVAYDEAGGTMAARLWWLARWLGHEAVAVLDGGLAAWRAAGYPVASGDDERAPRAAGVLTRRPPLADPVAVEAVERHVAARDRLLLDARGSERYRGETEPIDPVAGHIPGALNRPQSSNLRPDGRFLPAPVLRQAFDALLAGRPPGSVVHYCGSGVSACHNLLAMEHAGLRGSALYPGSWSQWCSDPSRPVETGEPG